MTFRKPLVLNGTQVQNIQAGDLLDSSTYVASALATLTNGEASVALVIGMPVYSSAAGSVKRAQANTATTTVAVGLVYDTSIAAGATGNIINGGVFAATTAQWDAVTGQTGGLTPQAAYYLDPANLGKITAVAPTTAGQYFAPIGRALSATQMAISIPPTILL